MTGTAEQEQAGCECMRQMREWLDHMEHPAVWDPTASNLDSYSLAIRHLDPLAAACTCARPQVEPINDPCYWCGEPTNGLAGDPGEWPIFLCHAENPGVVKAHHERCVMDRLERQPVAEEGSVVAALTANVIENRDYWTLGSSSEALARWDECKRVLGVIDQLTVEHAATAHARRVEAFDAAWHEWAKSLTHEPRPAEDKAWKLGWTAAYVAQEGAGKA